MFSGKPNSNRCPGRLLFGWLLLAAPATPVPAVESGVADIRRDATVIAVEQVMPSVVNIAIRSVVPVRDPMERAYREFWHQKLFNEYTSLGSGVVIDEAGYLLTNEHVVRGANQIAVRFGTGTNDYSATLVAVNRNMDVALLKLNGRPGEKFHAIRLAREDDLLLGETVLALGNPFGLGGSVTRGILSSKSRRMPKEGAPLNIPNWLQTDAPINPGNSGGPLVNLRGELIGLNVAILEGAQGIGFAIPIKEVRQALADIFNPETASRWFGARLSVTPPLRVRSVDPRSPAGAAGLRVGDAIVAVDGQPARDYIELNRTLRESAKENFNLTVRRDGEAREVKVRLTPFGELFQQRMGVDLKELTGELVEQLGLGRLGGLEAGLLISRVEKGSPAEKAGLREYEVVNGIGGQRVRNYLDAFQAVVQVKPGERTEISVLSPRTRGNLILGYQEGAVEVRLK